MKENSEGFQNEKEFSKKYSPEDQEFFDGLAKEYGLDQDPEHLIINKKNGERIFIRKWREIPTKTGSIEIEDLIKRYLEENGG